MLAALAATGVVLGLAVTAYAVTAPGGAGHGRAAGQASTRSWRPTISKHPDKVALSNLARFDFDAGRRAHGFRCRLDSRRWKECRGPVSFAQLGSGGHAFAVLAFDRYGRRSAAARFRWRILEAKAFSIAPHPADAGTLFPGAPPVALPLTIENPNPAPIFVISLRVTASADPPGCPHDENLSLIAASVSSAAPLRIPAEGSASLPAPGLAAPAIQLRDLPVNQDACRGARFPLSFSGEARG
jgi:hypothetical protein